MTKKYFLGINTFILNNGSLDDIELYRCAVTSGQIDSIGETDALLWNAASHTSTQPRIYTSCIQNLGTKGVFNFYTFVKEAEYTDKFTFGFNMLYPSVNYFVVYFDLGQSIVSSAEFFGAWLESAIKNFSYSIESAGYGYLKCSIQLNIDSVTTPYFGNSDFQYRLYFAMADRSFNTAWSSVGSESLYIHGAFGEHIAYNIQLYPEDNINIGRAQIKSNYRTQQGLRLSYIYANYDKIKIDNEYITTSDAQMINQWWSENAMLDFAAIDSGENNFRNFNDLKIVNKDKPFSQFQYPYENYYKGSIELEGAE